MGDYMAGRIDEPPWGAYGLTRQPVIGGELTAGYPIYRQISAAARNLLATS